jgi:gamma-glutamyltranspeptidase / glutathione hydrolase
MNYFKIFFLIFTFSCSNLGPRKVPLSKGEVKEDHESFAKEIMIVTQGKRSTQIGLDINTQGGNIYDIAVAISFALSVERPQSTGLGGGGFFLHYQTQFKEPLVVDFREKAPIKSIPKMFLNQSGEEVKDLSREGILSVGVPGMVAGLLEIHRKFGRLSLEQLIAPSIILADKGFEIYPELGSALLKKEETLRKYSEGNSPFFKSNGTILKTGDILIQKDLANTLRAIASFGRRGFYRGFVAQKILETTKKYNGIISQEDLDKYDVRFRNSLQGSYKGYKIYSLPLPSSGGILLVEILNILEGYDLKSLGAQSLESIHLMNTAFGKGYLDRALKLGDGDFEKIYYKDLISKDYAKKFRDKIKKDRAFNFEIDKSSNNEESTQTTHFTIMDSNGNTISSTQTINGYFGSGVLVPGTGVFLNNEMDDFSAKEGSLNLFGAIGGRKNLIKKEKRPLSSMTPTLIFKNGKPILALGSPAGTKIITCVAQTILNYLEHGLSLYDSVAMSRTHYQVSPNYIMVEKNGLPSATIKGLKGLGYKVLEEDTGCKVQAISLENMLHGVSDPRGFGLSSGI